MIEKVKLFKKKFFYFKNIIANTILVIYMLICKKFHYLFIYLSNFGLSRKLNYVLFVQYKWNHVWIAERVIDHSGYCVVFFFESFDVCVVVRIELCIICSI